MQVGQVLIVASSGEFLGHTYHKICRRQKEVDRIWGMTVKTHSDGHGDQNVKFTPQCLLGTLIGVTVT